MARRELNWFPPANNELRDGTLETACMISVHFISVSSSASSFTPSNAFVIYFRLSSSRKASNRLPLEAPNVSFLLHKPSRRMDRHAYFNLKLVKDSSSAQISATLPTSTNRFLLKSSSEMRGATSRILASSRSASRAIAIQAPSRMTTRNSFSCANFRRILSKPTSSATLPDMITCLEGPLHPDWL
jgi:hypothetical protein